MGNQNLTIMKKIIALIVVLFIVGSCESAKQLKSLEAENVELKKRIGDFEISMNDTDQDGVPDYLDVEPNSLPGIAVDSKGRVIVRDSSGVPDELENLDNHIIVGSSNAGNNTSPSKTVTVVKYLKGATKTIKVQSEILVLPENLIGNIAFNCPLKMREEQTYTVNAMLGTLFSKEEIQQSLLESINESRKENNERLLKMEDVLTREVNLGYYLKVTLKDGGNSFDIKEVDESANTETRSILDLTTGKLIKSTYLWQWSVTPKPKSKGTGKLYLLITPLDKDKKPMDNKRKEYPIKIDFKQSFLESFWEEMNRNIPWAVGSIIAPIITFLIGRYKTKEGNQTV